MPEFNLKKYLEKTASYEGAQGYFSAQSRAWCNCYKEKLDKKVGAQDAWSECLEEYDKASGNAAWAIKHAGVVAEKLYKDADIKDRAHYSKLIHKKLEAGADVKAAIFAVLEEIYPKKD